MPAMRAARRSRTDPAAGKPTSPRAADRLVPDARAPHDTQFLRDIATYLRDRHLAPVAVLWLESFRPLTFLGGQALLAVTPLLEVFAPRLPLARVAELLEDRTNLDRLVDELTSLRDHEHDAPEQGAQARRKDSL
jgi:hypothetical protein